MKTQSRNTKTQERHNMASKGGKTKTQERSRKTI